ncbi:MAG: molybdopterin-dependent oxidoreductase [Deltaproteobacteria bacterium]|nr:molybdopterin-dependent oxidoreductase [Deltaproteobacteria bacterium]
MRYAPVLLFVACAMVPGFARGASSPLLEVSGDIPGQLALGAADLAALPRAKVTVRDEHGTTLIYQGVPALEILQRAGAPLGKELRGSNMTMCVVAGGSDGYQAAFALAEFDPGFTDQVILVADHRDGRPLNSREGPLRLIVPRDKRPARWVRGLTTLRLKNAR